MGLSKVEIVGLPHPIYYREGTSDAAILNATFGPQELREYLFPMFNPKIVLDIGANFGAVSVYLSKIYPEAKIHAFEPVKENFELLVKNTESYENISCWNFGLGARDSDTVIFSSDDPTNKGGFSQYVSGSNINDYQKISIRTLKSFCDEMSINKIDVVKIDCEGAEYSILEGSQDLVKDIDWIAGELHGVDDFLLLDLLNRGFELAFKKDLGQRCYHFLAKNRKV